MNRPIVQQRLVDARQECTRLTADLDALLHTDLTLYPENFSNLSISAALRGERLTCHLRELASLVPAEVPYLRQALVQQNILVQQIDGTLTVTLPGLLPKRKNHTSPDFLIAPLYHALAGYLYPIRLYDHTVICITHIYDAELGQTAVRDHDNIEVKPVLDAVALFALPDDSGLCCSLFQSTAFGERHCTVIRLLDAAVFPAWLAQNIHKIHV